MEDKRIVTPSYLCDLLVWWRTWFLEFDPITNFDPEDPTQRRDRIQSA